MTQQQPDGPPIPMSEFTLGERYGSEDMYRDFPELKLGDSVGVEINGVMYTDTVDSFHYTGGSPAIYRNLNRWQWLLRRLTPPRWRRPLLVRPAESPTVTINGGGHPNPVGKTLAQLKQMKAGMDRLLK